MVDPLNPDNTGTFSDETTKLYESLLKGSLRYKNTVTDDSLNQSEYDFSWLAFPNDIGANYNGHYMVININVPTKADNSLRASPSSQKFFDVVTPVKYSKVDTLRFSTSANFTNINNVASGPQGEGLSIPRFTRRIKQSIALFMPNALVYSSQNAYEDISLTSLAGTLGVGIIGELAKILPNRAGAFVTGVLNTAGSVIGQVSRLTQNPINPRVEILYATTPQRTFTFEVLMAPRNANESLTLFNIVKTLRFHSAPEISDQFAGLTFIPPAEFDITFFNKGVENTNIPRINTCVLERIDVDYAPAGPYSTFNNGHPVAVRLSMGFREVEIVHKNRILQGF